MSEDDVYSRIGALEADRVSTKDALIEHKKISGRRHDKVMEKLDRVIELQIQTNGRVGKNEADIADITKDGGKLDTAYQNSKDWKDTKRTAFGAIFGISIAGGGIGTTFVNWWRAFGGS